MATYTNDTLTELENIEEQFLAMVPIRNLKFMTIDISEDRYDIQTQVKLLQKTVLSTVATRYPPSLSYRKLFLKSLLKKFESSGIEVCDQFYEEFTKLMAVSDTEVDEVCYRTYTLPTRDMITMRESTHLISHGTTGLQTWPAALCLAEWAMENKHVLATKNIIELGCGLGLTGLIICRTCTPTQYTFTDCHQHVLRTLQENIDINQAQQACVRDYTIKSNVTEIQESQSPQSQDEDITDCMIKCDATRTRETHGSQIGNEDIASGEGNVAHELRRCSGCCQQPDGNETDGVRCCDCRRRTGEIEDSLNCQITMTTLDWENVEESVLCDFQADVILAADVVYDTGIVPSLVSVLHRLLLSSNSSKASGRRSPPVAYVASTIRNEETYQCFLDVLGELNIKLTELSPPTHPVFYYDTSCPIKLLHLTL